MRFITGMMDAAAEEGSRTTPVMKESGEPGAHDVDTAAAVGGSTEQGEDRSRYAPANQWTIRLI